MDKVAFTGATATGSLVMQGAAQHVARVSLELGGKSPNIVFADADLEAAANGIVAGVYAATGQTCMAGSRLLVHEVVHEELAERVAARARAVRLGDPLDPATEMGPVAFREHLDQVLGWIGVAEQEGARLVSGGRRPSSPELKDGYFVEPTLSGEVDNAMQIAREEVSARSWRRSASVTRRHAMALANDSA